MFVQRPNASVYLPILFVGIAISLPLQALVIYGHSVGEWTAILSKLSSINWLLIGALMVSAVHIWRVSPYLKWSMPVTLILMGLNNYIVGTYATDYSLLVTSAATLGFLVINLPLTSREILWLLKNPQRRWWLCAHRHRLHVPVLIEGTRLLSIKAETFDISESGIFVPLEQKLGVGDWITVRMSFGTLSQIRCQGKVVRQADAKGSYPMGVGIQFESITRRQRQEISRFLARHASAAV